MAYDFTTVPDRRNTNSLKWDNVLSGEHPDLDPIPLWVADMDFAAPPAVVEALRSRVDHSIFGYTNLPRGYFETVSAWYLQRYGRNWDPRYFLGAPSVLHGLSMAVRAFTNPGDRILNLPPVYYPFYKVAQLNDREIFDVPLVRKSRWEMDFDTLDAALGRSAAEGKPVKALLFSAPHNPTGRVWTREELEGLGALARKHNFLIFSDEIHADLTLDGRRHLGPLDLPELADRTVVFAGPNKTFNLAGLPISHMVAFDDGLRTRLKRAVEADFYDQPNVLSLTSAWTAYREGGPWLDELLVVIEKHRGVLEQFVASLNQEWTPSPAVTMAPLEATYLAWVDVTGLVRRGGFESDKDLGLFLEKSVRVKMTPGSTFQTGGQNHLRFNLATPRALLDEGLSRVKYSLAQRFK